MEKCRRLPAAIAYFALPGFFQPGEILRCKRARIDVGKRRALKVRFQRPGDRAVKMVLQLMPFPRIDGLYSGVWDGSSW